MSRDERLCLAATYALAIACKLKSFSFCFFASGMSVWFFHPREQTMVLPSSLAELLASEREFPRHLMNPTEA